MIDTIVLTVKSGMFTILDHNKFSPSTIGFYDSSSYYNLGSRGNFKCVQNPTKTELKLGIYKPRLTVYKRINQKRKFEIVLKIEFSVPKLVFGNNFNEVCEKDFSNIINKLKNILKNMGVFIFEESLIEASVSAVHFSKNIVLTDYSIPYTYISQLKKLDINKRLDVNQTDFRNAGSIFKFRTNSFEIVFYDKMKELEQGIKSEKRSEEKDNILQLNLFDYLKQKKPFEVLRYEIRLNKRQKIISILNKIKYNAQPIFKNIFNENLARDILLYYINEMENMSPKLPDFESMNYKDFFESILLANQNLRLSQALEITGFKALICEVGVREFRQLISRFGNYQWYKLNSKFKKLKYKNKLDIFSFLRKEISEFKLLRSFDNDKKMLNNVNYN